MSDHYDNTGITGRAWFKPLVALWFGALAAAGMWFMPPDVHGSIVSATQLDRVHPIFSQPLGQQGIIALCAIAGLLGLLIGLLIAWRIAVASAPRAFAPGFEVHDEHDWADSQSGDDEFEQPRRRRVFSAHEDIGEQGIAVTAPPEEEEQGDYEDEYTIEDIPPASPEEDFETVYAELEEDYTPAEDAPAFEEEVEAEREPLADYGETEADEAETREILDAEFVEAEDELAVAEFEEPEAPAPASAPSYEEEAQPLSQPFHDDIPAPTPQPAPVEDEVPLGDMSLDGLLDRLEGALEKHSRMVDRSERAAHEAPPEPAPMRRAPPASDVGGFTESAEDAQGLPEVSDDDPVIAFLRREASRRMPESNRESEGGDGGESENSSSDAQAALRSALDRLGQTGHRD